MRVQIQQWAPWVLTCVVGVSQWLLGEKERVGWVLIFITSLSGIGYNIVTGQYGFIPTCIFQMVLAVKYFHSWEKTETEPV